MTDHNKAMELPISGEVMKHTVDIRDAGGRLVCKIEHGATGRSMQIARDIVTAVNAYDRDQQTIAELREALNAALNHLDEIDNAKHAGITLDTECWSAIYFFRNQARAALDRAKE